MDDDGRCAALVSGTVPSCIGQTSVASEWCAAAVVAHLAVDVIDGAQDCKGVVSEWTKPLAHRLRPSSVHAGQSRELLAHKSASLVALRWIRGHGTSRRKRRLVKARAGTLGAMGRLTPKPTKAGPGILCPPIGWRLRLPGK